MNCSFVRTNKEWICSTCGRRSATEKIQRFQPTAICRIPENYKYKTKSGIKKGFGTCLLEIIQSLDVDYEPMSLVYGYIKYLNTKSKEWCLEHTEEILILMKKEAHRQRIFYLESLFKAIIRLSIRKMS